MAGRAKGISKKEFMLLLFSKVFLKEYLGLLPFECMPFVSLGFHRDSHGSLSFLRVAKGFLYFLRVP